MGAPGAPYMAKTDKERLATGFWNRIEGHQAADCNTDANEKILMLSEGPRPCPMLDKKRTVWRRST